MHSYPPLIHIVQYNSTKGFVCLYTLVHSKVAVKLHGQKQWF